MHTYDKEDIAVANASATRARDGLEQHPGLRPLDWMALIVLVTGGLNCGLIAAVNLDVFSRMLPWPAAARVAYGLVGLAALHCVVLLCRLAADDA
ncbi:MAG: DUF378 domain-containing protein [Achromobacter sp.]|uniref:DUF378 domain-containing protein n=1 Tax=Achromobacter sp. TaxID=134375 RepID=UPI003D00CA5F